MSPETAPLSAATTPVRKRRVFYFSGYDPRGPGHYHSLYRDESKLQSALNGLELSVGKRRRVNRLANAWRIDLAGPRPTTTEFEFLRWDDLIRSHWPKNELQLLKSALPVYWTFLRANLIGRLLRIAWPSALTVSYPLIAFFGSLLAGLAIASALIVLPPLLGYAWWVGVVPALGALAGSVVLSRWLDQRFRSYWLLRIYGFMQPWAYGKIPAADERIREFAAYIADQIRDDDADEVLVVGHSVGTILTIPLVAELLRLMPDLGSRGPAFGLVSLGNCIPLVSLLPHSGKLRDDMLAVATAPGVRWLDFSARRDGASVTQVDPLAVSGVKRPAGVPQRPLQFPMRIFRMFPPDVYEVIKKDIFRIHFQYIMAAELPTDYDFFAITAGPVSLAERYPETPSSTCS